ncbi:zinc finger protein hangover isoform X1 [Ricinus communis]|uniref:zinc finger protein hangover isoform X1 n=2 Tax=Ricinus communis TaxID=3988 RepID=UPI00201A8718|nr:zinc finger protein hangover isoform X1 [Ricinus communis]
MIGLISLFILLLSPPSMAKGTLGYDDDDDDDEDDEEEEDGDDHPGKGGGSEGGYIKLTKRELASSLYVEPLNLSYISPKQVAEDVFFGTDDMSDMKEIAYKDHILECYRRESAMKNLKKNKNSWSPFNNCFDFLKVIFSLKF